MARHQLVQEGKCGDNSRYTFLKYISIFLRFRAAEPEKPWSGVRDASREGQSCPHKNMILDTFKGDEDCLFLNVFTTRMPKEDE